MKKLILVLLFVNWLTITNAQSWQLVGSAGFSAWTASRSSIAIDSSGTPYVVYQYDYTADSGIATVMKYNGSSWVTVGNADFSTGSSNTGGLISIAINSSGTPYVVYEDHRNSNKATVMKYNGINWDTVGNAGFSEFTASNTSIAIDGSGTPYVAYSGGGGSGANATVMKYNGSSWVTVGSTGFSAGTTNYISIAIDSSGTPYVAYQDGSLYPTAATVMKYNGSSWVTVGNAGFSEAGADYTSIALNGSGTPYVAYTNFTSSSSLFPATVMKYNGSTWVTVGSGGFSAGTAIYTSIAIDSSGTPYVAYQDAANSNKATVMKFNGSSWDTVGTTGFSVGTVYQTSIAIDSRGTPYVVYEDAANGNKATVMKYGSITGIQDISNEKYFSLYPNPANSLLTFRPSFIHGNDAATVSIMNVLGELIQEDKIILNKQEINVAGIPDGIYLLRISSENNNWIGRFVKQ